MKENRLKSMKEKLRNSIDSCCVLCFYMEQKYKYSIYTEGRWQHNRSAQKIVNQISQHKINLWLMNTFLSNLSISVPTRFANG